MLSMPQLLDKMPNIFQNNKSNILYARSCNLCLSRLFFMYIRLLNQQRHYMVTISFFFCLSYTTLHLYIKKTKKCNRFCWVLQCYRESIEHFFPVSQFYFYHTRTLKIYTNQFSCV